MGSGADAAARSRIWLDNGIAAFRTRSDEWRAALAADTAAFPASRLRAELDTLRLAYKSIEAAVETLQPQCLELFNGAPFDRVDEDEPFKIEIENPQGLQVLEAEIYREAARSDKPRIGLLLAQLSGAADQLASLLRFSPPDDAMLWEAAENEVIRVLAMGLSGYDTPASGKGLKESGAALHSLREFIPAYRARLDARDRHWFRDLDRALNEAVHELSAASDFDGFDRLGFIRRRGNPLFAALTDARRALGLGRSGVLPGVPRSHRAQPIAARAVSPAARSLFAPGFLDREFYALDYDGLHRRPASSAAAELGRKLFFDPILSGDNRRACASCHRPAQAFAEPTQRSAGFRAPTGRPGDTAAVGERNAPSLVYAAYQTAQFWDLRAGIIEDQIGHVVSGHQEFNTTFAAIRTKVAAVPAYAADFARAFTDAGAEPVSEANLSSALAQYVRSLAGWNSPFELYARGERDTLDPAAGRGFNLFMGKARCGTCHFPPAFNGTVPPLYRETESEVLGVPADDDPLHPAPDPDPGRFRVRKAALWKGAFKTPTVRNAAMTAPYMHNGQLADLESVLRFYNAGGGQGMGLPIPNQTLPPDSLGLSSVERKDLIAFLNSLGDDPLKADAPGVLPRSPQSPEPAVRRPGGEY